MIEYKILQHIKFFLYVIYLWIFCGFSKMVSVMLRQEILKPSLERDRGLGSFKKKRLDEGHWRKVLQANGTYSFPLSTRPHEVFHGNQSHVGYPRSLGEPKNRFHILEKILFWRHRQETGRNRQRRKSSSARVPKVMVSGRERSRSQYSGPHVVSGVQLPSPQACDRDTETDRAFLKVPQTPWQPERKVSSNQSSFSSQRSSVHSEGSAIETGLSPDESFANKCHRGPAKEFIIPYKDLWIKHLIKCCKARSIYKGRWHGEVDIHRYHGPDAEGRYEFWSMVTQLHRVRHENIVMFMGAVVESDKYAIVLGSPTGPSLYESVHNDTEKINIRSKIEILKQVVNGVGFLHARGIVIQNICSRNIFLCPEVKVSLVDYSGPQVQCGTHTIQRACVPRGQLTYLAPEVVKEIEVERGEVKMPVNYTTHTDIYAFGTLIYELLMETFPYQGMETELVLWWIYKGRLPVLVPGSMPRTLQDLMFECWTFLAADRPSIGYLNKELNRSSSLLKRFSVSEPDQLHKLGVAQWFP